MIEGGDANFTCTVRGTGTLYFQWSHETQGVIAVNELTGREGENATDVLYVTNVTLHSQGMYWCNVTGERKTAGSTAAALIVLSKLF